MKRIKLLGLALVALFAMSAVAASVAMAEDPTILPVPTTEKPLTFTAKTVVGTTPFLESTSLKKIECEDAEGNGEFTTQDHGKVKITFLKLCKEAKTGAKCNSNGVAGIIELEGLIEAVDILPSATLDLGVWLEPFKVGGEAKKEDLKIECGVLKVTILGSLIASIDNAKKSLLVSLEKFKTIIALWHQKLGEQEIKECMFLETLCKTGPFTLKAKFTAEAAEELVGEEAQAQLDFEKEIEVHF